MKRLLDVAWIEEIDAPASREKDDPRRRYYRITARGRAAAREEARRLERLTAQAREKRLLPSARTAPSARGAR
jgi:DNA-binding PadR family transcriptional regulator